MKTDVVWYAVKRYAKRIDLDHLAPHDLRRTCARQARRDHSLEARRHRTLRSPVFKQCTHSLHNKERIALRCLIKGAQVRRIEFMRSGLDGECRGFLLAERKDRDFRQTPRLAQLPHEACQWMVPINFPCPYGSQH